MSKETPAPSLSDEEAKQRRSNRRQLIGMAAALTLFGGVPILEMILNLSSRS